MFDSRRIAQLIGETVREIGILVFVFAPLDAALSDRPAQAEDIATITAGALVLIIAGIILETEE